MRLARCPLPFLTSPSGPQNDIRPLAHRTRLKLTSYRSIVLAASGQDITRSSDVPRRAVDLREGREGLDFLGCHFRARMSGRRWEQRRIIRCYLHRWPWQQAMKRLREKIRARTGRNRVGTDIREVIAVLNPLLRGWGNYFRTGNAAIKFRQVDRHVAWRLKRLLIKKRGRNLHAGQADQWTEEWLHGMGLYKLSGTIRYPKAA